MVTIDFLRKKLCSTYEFVEMKPDLSAYVFAQGKRACSHCYKCFVLLETDHAAEKDCGDREKPAKVQEVGAFDYLLKVDQRDLKCLGGISKNTDRLFSLNFSSALCYCTAELHVMRASVVRPSVRP